MSITVLMTTYNCAPYISQAIKSILYQTKKDFEFLIIDDGSTDNTYEIVKSFNDKRIVYIRIEHIGRSRALNYGLLTSKYDWISIMDADDIAHPQRFENQIKAISGRENEICYTDAAYFMGNKIIYVIQNNFCENKLNEILALHGHFANSTFLFNKKHILSSEGYKGTLNVFEDYDLLLRIKEKSEFVFINEILQFQRIRKKSLSTSNLNNLNSEHYKIQEPYYKDLNNTFDIYDVNKQTLLKGWREFFYGDKNLARHYWNKSKIYNVNYKIILAYILSFLPNSVLNKIKALKLRLRLSYILNRNRKFRKLNIEFKSILFEVSK